MWFQTKDGYNPIPKCHRFVNVHQTLTRTIRLSYMGYRLGQYADSLWDFYQLSQINFVRGWAGVMLCSHWMQITVTCSSLHAGGFPPYTNFPLDLF